jgi:hypothetical protein
MSGLHSGGLIFHCSIHEEVIHSSFWSSTFKDPLEARMAAVAGKGEDLPAGYFDSAVQYDAGPR